MQVALKHALETMVIFPKWLRVEMNDPPPGYDPVPVDTFVISQPEGILNVFVLSCANLIIGDITTSDPYVVVRLGDKTYQTPVIYRNLNPVWKNAVVNFLVYDKSTEFLEIEVFPYKLPTNSL